MIHHKHTSLAFLSVFFALPGVAALLLLLSVHVWSSGHLRRALHEAIMAGDPRVYYVMAIAACMYVILLFPAMIVLKKLEHEPYARRARLALMLLAAYNIYLFLLAGTTSLVPAIIGFVLLVMVGWILDRACPHYL
ncbi:MAG: hypothetical protein A3I44_02965 [Candidatus Sungbacteria bacterium RIFCSPLOWO2_02_FULL_51_17]|uniref:Uncharacterized protein n=1 Tax=Candidatus Sungbacteria bacterium RIFCSPHIGHO2_02_FULL_51_29 TaxID=1802273 RepID=A0A1G2KUH1_9BACT|nr:MAG: hypothetical protein A2676_05955 [Candidatus Sungbacteria bacterium RIFCSPHIGHO2_01_FULL_51_22]OHA02282.1 MAG: hypothetical protein A3C16_03180 [Candidatus Sungbacteria bacterium RIFCSPHIGHO2_02_FULL_51_29]OHA07157.1 MAG: hypothetical protein A3B29_05135 [Candidatus Sungbacteria bacterium RIFCSPLOWO2_01_FULL_51_34]OHA11871.1 MAG: hypothetical protein A3I44_02965 [Candidatus Sungbacteria bacterium RIFCSPLOWO2_02_FULL_51_17]